MYKIHSRKVVQKIFVYWISFSSDFHYNFRGVLLQKILSPQHLIVKKSHQGAQYSFQGLFCICQHAISVHLISPHGLCNASQVNKQLKMILHMHSLPSTHTMIYTKANFHFIPADLTKRDYSERAWPGLGLHPAYLLENLCSMSLRPFPCFQWRPAIPDVHLVVRFFLGQLSFSNNWL